MNPNAMQMSRANHALYQATQEDLVRLYQKCEVGPVPAWDETGGEHVVWRGASTGMISVRGTLVPASRLALWGRTGRMFSRATQVCAVPHCIHPEHWEWDVRSVRVHYIRDERREDPGQATLAYLHSRGWVHHRFKA